MSTRLMKAIRLQSTTITKEETMEASEEDHKEVNEILDSGKKGYQLTLEEMEIMQRMYGPDWNYIIYGND